MSEAPDIRHLTAVVSREGDWYVAQCLEVDQASQGKTVEEALDNLREALSLLLEDEPVEVGAEHPLVTSLDVAVGA